MMRRTISSSSCACILPSYTHHHHHHHHYHSPASQGGRWGGQNHHHHACVRPSFLLNIISIPSPWHERPRRPWLEDQRAVGLKKGCKGQNFPNFCGFCFLRSEDQRRADFKEWAGNPLKKGYVLRQHRFSILFYSPPTLKSMWIWLKKFVLSPSCNILLDLSHL